MKKATHCIGIVGAGPAGIATAIQLKKLGFEVHLFDANNSDKITVGEHLAAEVLHELKKLSIPERLLKEHSIPCSEVQHAWGRSQIHYNESIFNPFGDSYILSRPEFDQSLLAHCKAMGIQVKSNSRVSKITPEDSQWKLQTQLESFVVDFLVDASGRNSKFHFGYTPSPKRRKDSLIGITKYLKPKEKTRLQKSHLLVESIPTGWWYTVQVSSELLICTLMTDPKIVSDSKLSSSIFWEEALKMSHHVKERTASFFIPTETYIQSAHSQLTPKVMGKNWAKVGDAAQSFDPLSSAGILKGFKMGIACGTSVAAYLNGNTSALELYEKDVQKHHAEYLKKRDEYYRQEERWRDQPFWYHRILHPKEIQKFSITPTTVLKVNSHGWNEKQSFLSNQIPEIQFEQLIESISQFPLAKDAIANYLYQRKETTLNLWMLHALESLLRLKAIEIQASTSPEVF